MPSLKRSRTVASSPHSTGEGMPEGAICLAMILNICPMKPAGRPVGHGDHAAGPAHAREFGRHQFRTRREHGPEHADHGVKLAVVIRQGLGVAFFKGDVQSFGGGAGPGFLDPVGGNVAAGNFCARPGGNQRKLSGAAADVEQPGSRFDAQPR